MTAPERIGNETDVQVLQRVYSEQRRYPGEAAERRLDSWIMEGATFKRPRGQQVYTPIERRYQTPKPYLTILSALCNTPAGQRIVSDSELSKMERIS